MSVWAYTVQAVPMASWSPRLGLMVEFITTRTNHIFCRSTNQIFHHVTAKSLLFPLSPRKSFPVNQSKLSAPHHADQTNHLIQLRWGGGWIEGSSAYHPPGSSIYKTFPSLSGIHVNYTQAHWQYCNMNVINPNNIYPNATLTPTTYTCMRH